MVTELERWRARQAERWVRDVVGAALRVKAGQVELLEMRADLEGLKAIVYSDAPGSPNAYADAIPDGISQLYERIERMEEERAEWEERDRWLRCAVRRVSHTASALITYRYLLGREWCEVADAIGYSTAHAKGPLKIRALAELWEFMPDSERDEVPSAI